MKSEINKLWETLLFCEQFHVENIWKAVFRQGMGSKPLMFFYC